MKRSFYDPKESVAFHVQHGPIVEGLSYEDSSKKGNFSFLGKTVSSLFGAPAFVLTMNSQWTTVLSKLSFDIITYKTVRSIEWPANPQPNWMYVDIAKQLTAEDLGNPVVGHLEPFENQEISTANSFGVPSQKPEVWQPDFEVAKKNMKEGQLLILSIMTSPIDDKTDADDAKRLGELAAQTSADVFEVNLACPNTARQGLIFEDVDLSLKICSDVKSALKNRPLLAKVGYYKNPADLKRFMTESKGIIAGIASTNTFAMKIIAADGSPAFGEKRPVAGVAGAGIRNLAHEQIKRILEYKKELGLSDFVVIGIGGVTKPEHVKEYLDMGVDAVQAASILWENPYIAKQYKETYL